MKIATTVEITSKLVTGLISTAFEGGSNYWITKMKRGITPKTTCEYTSDWPMAGGTILITDEDGKTGILSEESCKAGLDLMAEKYPRHFKNLLDDSWDAETADVFLQLAVLGELVYG